MGGDDRAVAVWQSEAFAYEGTGRVCTGSGEGIKFFASRGGALYWSDRIVCDEDRGKPGIGGGGQVEISDPLVTFCMNVPQVIFPRRRMGQD